MHRGAGGTGYANEGTAWDDTLIKMGIKEDDREPKATPGWGISADEAERAIHDTRLELASLDELDELEDDEDESVLAAYRAKRLAELKQSAVAKSRVANGLPEIYRNQWSNQVTDASRTGKVVVLLFKPGDEWCALLERQLCVVATRFPAVRFLKCVSTSVIPDFPDARLPTLLVYDGDKPIEKITGVTQYGGGSKMTPDDVEWTLHVNGIIKSEMPENPRN